MLQEPAELGPVADAAQTLAAAGLGAADAHPDLPPQEVSTGYRHLIAPVRNPDVLARCKPTYAALDALMESRGCGVLYLAAVDLERGEVQARSFYCDMGSVVSEDAATGSAAGCLAAYLHDRAGIERITIDQGAMMGRPGRIDAQMDLDRVRVAGDVVVLAVGEIRLGD